MNIFEELNRLKSKGLTVFIMLNSPDFLEEEADEDALFDQVAIGVPKQDEPSYLTKRFEEETIEQLLYRSILEFDDEHPEYL